MHATNMERKAEEIARCLGYQHAFHVNDDVNDLVANSGCMTKNSGKTDAINIRGSGDSAAAHEDVHMWHLRSLAIQTGGLLNSHGRKLGWFKLAGVDDLVFNGEQAYHSKGEGKGSSRASSLGDNDTYEQLQKHLDQEMEPSKWHIQRERRRLRKKTRGTENSSQLSSPLSHSSKNDLSSIGSNSGSSTPLTANLNTSYAGTPKSVSFYGLESIPAGHSFTAFPTKQSKEYSPTSLTVDTSLDSDTLNTSLDNHTLDTPSSDTDNSVLGPPSPYLSSPTALPQSQLYNKFQCEPQSCLQYSHKYQRKSKQMKPKAKKDRRAQERKLLVQIATSAFYLIQPQQGHGSHEDFQYYPGLQDLIAVLLLHLESPSLTSLLLKQIVKSHLFIYSVANEDTNIDYSFASCIDDVGVDGTNCEKDSVQNMDVVSLSFFPLLEILDTEFHDSLVQINKGHTFLDTLSMIFGKVLRKWISSWFCCHDTLPITVVSRVVDFFLASHPSMPM